MYENAQSIIKNEAAISLGLQTDDLKVKMLGHQDVQYWIGCLQQFMKKPQVHNSADICLENSMHKLFSFGVRETDDQRICEVNQFILELMRTNEGNQRFYDTINPTITASWLACMGHEEQLIIDILRERVEAVYSFIKSFDYNIYVYPEDPLHNKLEIHDVSSEKNVLRRAVHQRTQITTHMDGNITWMVLRSVLFSRRCMAKL